MNKKGKLISGCLALSALFVAGGALTIKAPALAAENTVTMTIEMNGGFRVTSTEARTWDNRGEKDNRSVSQFSVDDIVQSVPSGKYELTYDNIHKLFPYGAFEIYDVASRGRTEDGKATEDYLIYPCGKKATDGGMSKNTFYITDEGYYCPLIVDDAQFPTALLFGLFEDSNGNGVLDDGEKAYYQGDTITLTNDIALKCFYDPLFNKGQRFRSTFLGGYSRNLGSQFVDNFGSSVDHYVALDVACDVDKVSNGTYTNLGHDEYGIHDLQPFAYQLRYVGDMAFKLRNEWDYAAGITGIELPDTVVGIGYQAFMQRGRLKYIRGLENVSYFGDLAFYNVSSNPNVRSYSNNLKIVFGENIGAFYGSDNARYTRSGRLNNWAGATYIFTGFNAEYVERDTQGKSTTPLGFNVEGNIFGQVGNDYPDLVYVPYGETAKWYPTAENSSGFTQNYEGIHFEGTARTVPMRESYRIKFNLNGGITDGKLYDEFMDAGAVSVKNSSGKELNVFEDGSKDATGENSYNPTVKDLSLLKATKPADPTKEGYEFIGWEDQFGYVWTEEDWTNGGKNDYETGVITLSAKWQKAACSFSYATLSLDGTIGVNMYASLNSEALATEDRVFVRFTYSDNTTEEVELDKNNNKQINGETLYKFTARVAAADTDKDILCQLFVGEIEKANYTIKVEDYTAYEKANNVADSTRYKLADALEAYGRAARTYFGESTETVTVDSENAITAETLSAYAPSIDGNDVNVTVQDVTLLLESKTALRIYFKVNDETQNVDITVDGTVTEAKKSENREGLYYVEIDNIAASDLDRIYSVVIGGYTVKCGALSYVRAAITSDNVNTVNMVKALYLYHIAAEAYFN